MRTGDYTFDKIAEKVAKKQYLSKEEQAFWDSEASLKAEAIARQFRTSGDDFMSLVADKLTKNYAPKQPDPVEQERMLREALGTDLPGRRPNPKDIFGGSD